MPIQDVSGLGSRFAISYQGSPNFVISGNSGIGINKVAPKYDLDVSGSGNFTNNLDVTGSVIVQNATVAVRKLRFDWGSIFANDENNELTLGSNYSDSDATRIFISGKNASNSPSDAIAMQANNGVAIYSGSSGDYFDPRYTLDVSGSGNFTNNLNVTGSFYLTDGTNNQNLRIYQPQASHFRFVSSAIGAFLDAGPGNILSTAGQNLQSLTRGAYFDATTAAANPLKVGDSGLFVESGSYNVGIGTTSPQVKLHVVGTSVGSGYARIENTVHYSKLDLKSSTQTGAIIMDGTGGYISGGGLVFDTSNSRTHFMESGVSKMSIISGNVGIGTDNPQVDLHISGSDELIRIGDGSSSSDAYISLNNRGYIGFDASEGMLWQAGTTRPINIAHGSGFGSSIQSRLYINLSGDVGIGTTSPSYKLDIVGDLRVLSSSINYQENTDVDTGTETIATVNTGSFDGAFFDYLIKSGSNLRAGTVTAIHDGTNVEYNEVSTQDLGSTTAVELSVDISGADMRLRATTTSDNWLIKSLVRTL